MDGVWGPKVMGVAGITCRRPRGCRPCGCDGVLRLWEWRGLHVGVPAVVARVDGVWSPKVMGVAGITCRRPHCWV